MGAPPPPRALARAGAVHRAGSRRGGAPLSPAPAALPVAPGGLPEVAIDVEDVGARRICGSPRGIKSRAAAATARSPSSHSMGAVRRRDAPLVGIGNSEAAAIAAAAGEANRGGEAPPPRRRRWSPARAAAAALCTPAARCGAHRGFFARRARARRRAHSAADARERTPRERRPLTTSGAARERPCGGVFDARSNELLGAGCTLPLRFEAAEQRRAAAAGGAAALEAAALGARRGLPRLRRPPEILRGRGAPHLRPLGVRGECWSGYLEHGRQRRRGRAFLLAACPAFRCGARLSLGAAAHHALSGRDESRASHGTAEAPVRAARRPRLLLVPARSAAGARSALQRLRADGPPRARARRPAPACRAFCECDGGEDRGGARARVAAAARTGRSRLRGRGALRAARRRARGRRALDRIHPRQHQAVPGLPPPHREERRLPAHALREVRAAFLELPARPRRAAPSSASGANVVDERRAQDGSGRDARVDQAYAHVNLGRHRLAARGHRARGPRARPTRTACRGGRRPTYAAAAGLAAHLACAAASALRPLYESAPTLASAVWAARSRSSRRRSRCSRGCSPGAARGASRARHRRPARRGAIDVCRRGRFAAAVEASTTTPPTMLLRACSRATGARAPAEAGEVDTAAHALQTPRPCMLITASSGIARAGAAR